MRELYQDFEVGVVTGLRNNLRAWHQKSPTQPVMAGAPDHVRMIHLSKQQKVNC